ncbi:MAG: ATP-binding protein, partial [Actinomycetota bacterium]|nr:ATP-binding protein [Actinomycetota bacterium]
PATPLPTPVEVALLRIAQAALGNTTQHAKATRADVTLTVMDEAVTLDVVDDGIGFATRAQAPVTEAGTGSGGFGLRSMTSRAAELGGVLTVESQPGRGTAISVPFDRFAATSPPSSAHEGPGELP